MFLLLLEHVGRIHICIGCIAMCSIHCAFFIWYKRLTISHLMMRLMQISTSGMQHGSRHVLCTCQTHLAGLVDLLSSLA
jgi:hypothetical protein